MATRDVVDQFHRKYLDYSLGDAVLMLVEAGWPEEDAATILVAEYESAWERRNDDVQRKSWVRLAETIVKNQAGQAIREEVDSR